MANNANPLHERSLKVETIPTEFGLATLGTPPQPKWKPEYGNTLFLHRRKKIYLTGVFQEAKDMQWTVQR